jgi:hypothetical protein
MALPRRKKPFTKDGATFTVSPLTYDEMEEYLGKLKATAERLDSLKLAKDAPIPPDITKERRENAFYVLCCGLNVGSEPAITPAVLLKEIDDELGAELVREILKLNGFTFPDKPVKADEGETQAGS